MSGSGGSSSEKAADTAYCGSRPGAAYSGQVRDWLNTVYQANLLHIRMYTTFSQQFDWSSLHQSSGARSPFTTPAPPVSTSTQAPTVNNNPAPQNVNETFRMLFPRNAGGGNRANVTTTNTTTTTTTSTTTTILENRIFTLAPLWKRIVAEMIDFIILLALKIIVALNAVEMLDIDLDNYEFLLDSLSPDSLDLSSMMDYNAAVRFSTELLILELMHRVIVCLYEAMCTSRGPGAHQGGATPGKFVMGLRVIKCQHLISTGGNRVLVTPAGNLGFGWALLRSILKNLSVATMFPLCISLTLDPNTRTVHDFLSNSVVVERQRQRH